MDMWGGYLCVNNIKIIYTDGYVKNNIYRWIFTGVKILLTHEFSVCILSPLFIQVTSKDASVLNIIVVSRCLRLRDSISFSFSVLVYVGGWSPDVDGSG